MLLQPRPPGCSSSISRFLPPGLCTCFALCPGGSPGPAWLLCLHLIITSSGGLAQCPPPHFEPQPPLPASPSRSCLSVALPLTWERRHLSSVRAGACPFGPTAPQTPVPGTHSMSPWALANSLNKCLMDVQTEGHAASMAGASLPSFRAASHPVASPPGESPLVTLGAARQHSSPRHKTPSPLRLPAVRSRMLASTQQDGQIMKATLELLLP